MSPEQDGEGAMRKLRAAALKAFGDEARAEAWVWAPSEELDGLAPFRAVMSGRLRDAIGALGEAARAEEGGCGRCGGAGHVGRVERGLGAHPDHSRTVARPGQDVHSALSWIQCPECAGKGQADRHAPGCHALDDVCGCGMCSCGAEAGR